MKLNKFMLLHEIPTYTPTKIYTPGQILNSNEFNGELKALESYTNDIKAYFDGNVTDYVYEIVAGDGINIDFEDLDTHKRATISLQDIFNSVTSVREAVLSELPIGTIITLPFSYVVGTSSLSIHVDNEKWFKDSQYQEIGDTTTESSIIRILTNLSTNSIIEYKVLKIADTSVLTQSVVDLKNEVDNLEKLPTLTDINIGVVGLPDSGGTPDDPVSIVYRDQGSAAIYVTDTTINLQTPNTTSKKLVAEKLFENTKYSKDLSAIGSDVLVVNVDDTFKANANVVQRDGQDFYVWDANALTQGNRDLVDTKFSEVRFVFVTNGDNVLVNLPKEVNDKVNITDTSTYVGHTRIRANALTLNKVWMEDANKTNEIKAFVLKEGQDNTFLTYNVSNGDVTWTFGAIKEIHNECAIMYDVSTLQGSGLPSFDELALDGISQDTNESGFTLVEPSTIVSDALKLKIPKIYFTDLKFLGSASKESAYQATDPVRVIFEYSTLPEDQLTGDDSEWEVLSMLDWDPTFVGALPNWLNEKEVTDFKLTPNHLFRVRGFNDTTSIAISNIAMDLRFKENGGET